MLLKCVGEKIGFIISFFNIVGIDFDQFAHLLVILTHFQIFHSKVCFSPVIVVWATAARELLFELLYLSLPLFFFAALSDFTGSNVSNYFCHLLFVCNSNQLMSKSIWVLYSNFGIFNHLAKKLCITGLWYLKTFNKFLSKLPMKWYYVWSSYTIFNTSNESWREKGSQNNNNNSSSMWKIAEKRTISCSKRQGNKERKTERERKRGKIEKIHGYRYGVYRMCNKLNNCLHWNEMWTFLFCCWVRMCKCIRVLWMFVCERCERDQLISECIVK